MAETEGVTKFQLEFSEAPAREFNDFSRLNAWRSLCHRLRLIGQDPNRYGGFGYGNISHRLEPLGALFQPIRFIISGTQTGQLERLGIEHYCTVLESDPRRNRVIAEGPVKPSSEALTHAAVYAADDQIRYVFHVHSPEIWRRTRQLRIPSIPRQLAYGTPEMADSVGRLLRTDAKQDPPTFSMLGHEDGIVTFGPTLEQAGQTLIRFLALALAEQNE